MNGRLVNLVGAMLLACVLAANAAEPGAEAKAVFDAYGKEFNTHDAKLVAQHWTTDAVYLDTETGERTEGREAIQKDFEALFSARPTVKAELKVHHVRLIAEGVASAEGVAKITEDWQTPRASAFTAILVKKDDKWLISNVQESTVPPAANAPAGLKELEWLVGKWKDQGDGTAVETEVRWAIGGSFLVRTFRGSGKDGAASTQIIGWDPDDKSIRSWTFDGEGSFGEETWEKTDDGWNIHLDRTLADGRSASATQIIKKISDREFSVRMIDAEVEGEMLPAGPIVKVGRVGDAPKS